MMSIIFLIFYYCVEFFVMNMIEYLHLLFHIYHVFTNINLYFISWYTLIYIFSSYYLLLYKYHIFTHINLDFIS